MKGKGCGTHLFYFKLSLLMIFLLITPRVPPHPCSRHHVPSLLMLSPQGLIMASTEPDSLIKLILKGNFGLRILLHEPTKPTFSFLL